MVRDYLGGHRKKHFNIIGFLVSGNARLTFFP
jgi:hypothetical protein